MSDDAKQSFVFKNACIFCESNASRCDSLCAWNTHASNTDSSQCIEALQSAARRDADAIDGSRRRAANDEGELATAERRACGNQTLIAHLKLTIAKMQRDRFGPKSERTARLLDQMELQLEELEANVSEDDLAAEEAAASRRRRHVKRQTL